MFSRPEQRDRQQTIVTLFECGDQQAYSDTFQDARGIIGRIVCERGATVIDASQLMIFSIPAGLKMEYFSD